MLAAATLLSASMLHPIPPMVQPAAIVRQQLTLSQQTQQQTSGVFPATTMLLASDSQVAAKPFTKSGILQPTQTGDLIKGGTADLDLGALVDDIPVSDLDLH